MDKIKKLLLSLGQAILDFKMFDGQDSLAVAVSGGLDSIALVHLLVHYRKKMNQDAPIVAIHAPGDGQGSQSTALLQPLKEHLLHIGVNLLFAPFESKGELTCNRCARVKKKGIFQTAKEAGCRIVVYGHHCDDMIHTALMNLFLHSRLEGLHPIKLWFNGQFKVIRPLIYIPKKQLHPLAKILDFPPPPSKCPLEDKSSRAYFSQLVETLGKECPVSRPNIFWGALGAMGYPIRKRQKNRPSI